MNDLLAKLEAAISETERIALEANHNGRWFTYGGDGPDEGRLYVDNVVNPDAATVQLEWMRKQLSRCTYKPGWQLEIDDNRNLVSRRDAQDSRDPASRIGIKAVRPMPDTWDEDEFARHVLAGLDGAEKP